VKARLNAGRRRDLYHFRDEQGLEVHFVMPGRGRSISLVECRAGATVTPATSAPMQRLVVSMNRRRQKEAAVAMHLVHEAPRAGVPTKAIAPGVHALAWRDFVHGL